MDENFENMLKINLYLLLKMEKIVIYQKAKKTSKIDKKCRKTINQMKKIKPYQVEKGKR